MHRNGDFYRKSDSKWIARYRCHICSKTRSRATQSPAFGQNKRKVNPRVRDYLCSGMSQRRAALLLGVHHKTIARKFHFLADQARKRQAQYLKCFEHAPLEAIQFDEMETHEHTKLKPLSIALAVSARTRKILGVQVSQMPARGPLAKTSVKKYGKRKDQRVEGLKRLFEEVSPRVSPDVHARSDQNPKYPRCLREKKLKWKHEPVKGKRGCITGQGELKKTGYDPLFALNHTAAMLRAHVNRLMRKTWNTTKKAQALSDHLALYMDFHNRVLTA